MSLTGDIKDYALNLGYHSVGVTTADPFPQFAEALQARYDMYKWAIEGRLELLRPADPKNFLPEAKSIVVAVYDFSQRGFPAELVDKIARAYLSRCYKAPADNVNGARNELMRSFLEKSGMTVAPWLTLASGPPDRASATRAGLTWIGNNSFAFAPGPGSFIIISSFLVDAELEYDSPGQGKTCPEGCQLCMKACPTGALFAPGQLDPRRCIGFQNFTTRFPQNQYIAPAMREKIGAHIHGCDVCQEACPWNQPRLKAKFPMDPYLERKAQEFDLHKVLNATDEYYANVLYPLMYNYLPHKKFLQRNAAIALGNIGNPDAVPHLAQAMEDPEELVRAHAAWALGKIGGSGAMETLERSLSRETEQQAKSEIQTALLMA